MESRTSFTASRSVTGSTTTRRAVGVHTSIFSVCSTVTLDREFERLAREQLRLALDTYAACREVWGDPRGPVRWPGYPDEVVTISPPPYATAASGPLSDEDDTEGDADELLAQLEGLMA